jgi:hypothetical protein
MAPWYLTIAKPSHIHVHRLDSTLGTWPVDVFLSWRVGCRASTGIGINGDVDWTKRDFHPPQSQGLVTRWQKITIVPSQKCRSGGASRRHHSSKPCAEWIHPQRHIIIALLGRAPDASGSCADQPTNQPMSLSLALFYLLFPWSENTFDIKCWSFYGAITSTGTATWQSCSRSWAWRGRCLRQATGRHRYACHQRSSVPNWYGDAKVWRPRI